MSFRKQIFQLFSKDIIFSHRKTMGGSGGFVALNQLNHVIHFSGGGKPLRKIIRKNILESLQEMLNLPVNPRRRDFNRGRFNNCQKKFITFLNSLNPKRELKKGEGGGKEKTEGEGAFKEGKQEGKEEGKEEGNSGLEGKKVSFSCQSMIGWISDSHGIPKIICH